MSAPASSSASHSPEPSTTGRRKKSTSEPTRRSPEDDHRRKRRNRMTQSCLNCHTSKRMCDRKRPCGRCTQLGLTGLCVYEVDDPNQRHEVPDEQTRLQKRVAELESVIRELKNKPHPRWTQPGSRKGDGSAPDSDDSDSPKDGTLSPSSVPRIHLLPPSATPSGASTPLTMMSASPLTNSPATGSSSPINTPPSPLLLTPRDGPMSVQDPLGLGSLDLASLLSPYYSDSAGLDGLFDGLMGGDGEPISETLYTHFNHHPKDRHCGCLNDNKSYSAVLELSLRLRRAAEILKDFPKHTSDDCTIHQRISALDRFTTEALGNVNTSSYASQDIPMISTPSNPQFSSPMRIPMPNRAAPPMGATISPQSLQGLRPWDIRGSNGYPSPPDDSFMSWEPTRNEWLQPSAAATRR